MEWKVIKLGELCRIELGKTPSRSNEFYWDKNKSGNNVWLSIADLPLSNGSIIYDSKEYISNAGKQICKVVPKGTLIVSFKLSIGRLAITGRDLYTNEAIASLYINEEKGVNQDYLCWYLTFFDWDLAVGNEVKLKGKTLNKAKLKEIEILAPSIPEQKRIVAILDQAFADLEQTRAKTEQNLKNARELFDSKKLNLFESLSNSSNLSSLPSVCDNIFAGGDAPKKGLFSKEKTEEFNIPIYANAVKNNGLYGFTDYSRANEPSITIAARGSGTGHIEVRTEPFLPIVRLIVLTPNKEIIGLEYLKHTLQTLDILRSGSAIPQLTVPMIKEYSIPIPDMITQEKIVSELESLKQYIDQIETIYHKKLIAIDELKKSILQKAFSGELTAKAE